MGIKEIQEELIDDFEFLTEWEAKYEYIIQMGKELPLIDPRYQVEANLIKGCQAQVWLHAEYKDNKVYFTADSDAIITKGLVSMVIRILSGHSPKEIMDADLFFVDRIGLREHLSVTRSNGLLSMMKQMKLYAIALHSQITGTE
ncbi:MAG: SufE family protein [Gemmatimonadaceae bacterium]|nr:SufE family protein [Chitinophagaceae bacterium]